MAVLLLVATVRLGSPRHLAVLPDGGGSGDGEEAAATPPARPVAPGTLPTPTATGTTVTSGSAPRGLLAGLVDFLKEHLLLVVVVGSLAFVLLFIVCAAGIVRQLHKASAYYPSSFPKKKYVDQRDKTGGPRGFGEVPEKPPEADAEEPQSDAPAATHTEPLANGALGEQNSPGEEEEKEGGSRKLSDEQPAEPPPQDPAA
ncbi:TM119 protein, partial [Rhinopomastus cyanomelas]|nr:TM119 protein [Rhinopomastus cyanomelas]